MRYKPTTAPAQCTQAASWCPALPTHESYLITYTDHYYLLQLLTYLHQGSNKLEKGDGKEFKQEKNHFSILEYFDELLLNYFERHSSRETIDCRIRKEEG